MRTQILGGHRHDEARIPFFFLTTLVLLMVTLSQAGCAGLTSAGKTTKAVTSSNSNVAPSISFQPGNQTVTAPQTATFSVTVSGTSPLSYQWKKNGAAINGATSKNYTTPATAVSDSGAQFTVMVSNSAGSAASNAAMLTVGAAAVAPAITTEPASESVTLGQAATFAVAASGASPLSYQWYKNGAAVGSNSSAYSTSPTTAADNQAQIQVTISNTAGSVTSNTATLTVTTTAMAPDIITQPTNQIVSTGQTATFMVVATGTSPLSYQWYENGAPIGTNSSTYTTSPTTAADNQAQIEIRVRNPAGSVTSNAATLTVNVTGSGPVPSSFFGMSIMDSSNWPLIPFHALEKAPGVQWPYVERTRGNFNWTQLDSFVAQANAHGVSFVYTSFYVPSWAAADQSSCVPSAYNVPVCHSTVANMQDWKNFMTALVTRYKGRIQVYELWNEPSCLCTYTGTVAQLVALTQAEHDVIRSIDPAALIIGPTMQGYGSAYLDSYFAAGGTKDIDAVGMHSSPNPNNDVAEFMMGSVTTGIKSVMQKYGLSSKPLWNTENDWGSNAALTAPDAQAAFIARNLLLNWNVGVTRDYWYAWDNSGVGTLWGPTMGVTAAATAYEQVESWMVGATIAPCSLNGSTIFYHALYTCNLTRSGGYQAQAVWNTDGNKTYTAPSQFTQYRDLAGHTYPIPSGQQVTIGSKPILLEVPAGTSSTGSPIVFATAALRGTTSGPVLQVIDGTGTLLLATAVGEYVSYTVTIPTVGNYDIKVGVKKTFNRGKWQLSINGANQGPVEDEYVSTSALAELDLGLATISSPGPKSFKFLTVGRNAMSTGYRAAFEYIKLTPQ
jgi:hypothetical protein